MRRVHVCFLIPLLLICTVSVSSAWAVDCQSSSPNLQLSKSIWSPVAAEPLSPQLRARVFAFFAGLDGHWQGSGASTACAMSGGKALPVKAPERLKLSVSGNGDAGYRFEFSVFDTKNKVSTTYGFVVKSHGQLLQVEGEGNLLISKFYSQGMRFRTQTAMRTGFRRKFGAGTSNTMLSLETVRQLTLQNGKLTFSKAVFHNGAMIDFSRWVFSRS